MVNIVGKLWRRATDLLPVAGFHFDRPLVLLQSDDWGRVGVRDQAGWKELCAAGVSLGERPYDFYSLETGDDLAALAELLKRHRDSVGRNPCLCMNFILANLDFDRMAAEEFREIRIVPLSEGVPAGWNRPGLGEAYRQGIETGVFYLALHGVTHFCSAAVNRNNQAGGDRADLLHTLWKAGTPYIHWRMPWIGYEYWDPEQPDDQRFLSAEVQKQLVGKAVGMFAATFSTVPRSACAPGYRANEDTHHAWAQHGIHVVQNGPGQRQPPHFDRYGLLHVCRTIEFEPAIQSEFSVDHCVQQAESCFKQGIPAIISVHSINFHSTVKDFRGRTLQLLEEFLSRLESGHPNLLYLHDQDLYEIVNAGFDEAEKTHVEVNVTRKKFLRFGR